MLIDLALVRRIEQIEAHNTADYAIVHEQLWPGKGSRLEPVADGKAVFTGTGFPTNRAVGLGVHGAISASDLDHVEHFFNACRVSAQVDVCPYADPSLLRALEGRSYSILRFLNVNVRPLTSTDLDVTPQIEITKVSPTDIDLWTTTVTDRLGSGAMPDEIGSTLAMIAFHRPGAQCFLAWINGEPAGAGAMAIRDRVVTMFSASTRRQFRNRGVQTALLKARLQAATHAGCDLALVTTTPGSASERNVQRAGFRVIYTKTTLIAQ